MPEKINRSQFIGGSDIAAVMGMSRWKTPLQLWAEKKGKVQSEVYDPESAEIGKEMEDYVSRWFSKQTGMKLRRDSRSFKHPKYSYMVGHIDRWIVGEDALFEAKTASAFKLKEWDKESIPTEYLLQVMWYLGLVRKKTGYIAVLIGGNRRIWKKIEFDKNLFDQMVKSAKEFKEEYLDKDLMPIAISGDDDFVDELWPESLPESTMTFEGEDEEKINNLIEERVGGLQVIKDAEREIDAINAKIKQKLGDNEVGMTGQYIVSWRNQIRESVDTSRLKEDGLFDKYKKTLRYRTFRTKKIELK